MYSLVKDTFPFFRFLRIFLLLFYLSLCPVARAQTPFIIHGTPDWSEGKDISANVFFYEDKARTELTLKQVQRQATLRPYAEKRNERTTHSDVTVIRTWLTFTIENTHPTDSAKMVFLMGAHAKGFLYQDEKLVFEGGLRFTPKGYVPHVNFLDFSVPPQSTHRYWLQVVDYEVSPMPILAQLHTRHTAIRFFAINEGHYKLLLLLMGILVGCLLFMTLYSLYHFWLTRDQIFGYYTLYAASAMAVAWLGAEGRFQLFYLTSLFKFDSSAEKGFDVISFNFVVPVFYILFVSKIAEIPKSFPRIWLVLKVFVVILICQQLLSMYQTYTREYFYSNVYYLNKNTVALAGTCLLLYAAIRSKSVIKAYLIAGILCFILLVFAPLYLNFFTPTLSRRPDIEAVVNLTMFWVFLGLALESMFFAFALGYRNRLVEVEKNQMQVRYAEQLERQLEFRTKEVKAQSKILEEQHIRQLESNFEQKIAETEMTALRAQMNPHFIFNCLNSIKLYTLENDALTASEYLTKFSRLIRLVLENSRSEKVTLENELNTLELYIEMEAMRFKNKVKYHITIDEMIDPQYIEIPPLLLQPYVENAIWHGLMHKEEGGTVTIAAEIQHNASLLRVIITDDGVGRAASNEFKSKSATKNKSFGLKMTSERIELINQLYKAKTQVKIEDLVNEDGSAAGTRVTVKIPI
ncbi:sensor histidine kinase [Runella slithyformis]|uniref:Signal transduction histidine kinase n=1 Tax=Runella slithyformis (strain ATCC 29530 / DSM 19594 / LMG 11500 / NCIMB 11436 / LSU 4) TaxID=761193 RepID=A0A7U3ZNE2_RUNSL|nr:histidine kinase [Runella slithyformis]AEI50421.1 putative signal transduction histidine kinase [Runella slithyformis DSM 19594]